MSVLHKLLWLPALALAAAAPPPEQPVAYSHKLHAGAMKLECALCHINPDPGEMMKFPPVSTCMQCHLSGKTNSVEIQKLTAYAQSGKPIKWVRVYEIPSYVNFSHRSHLQTGNTCEECHGKVRERVQLFREGDISMGGCMNCHRLKKASIDCNYCHEERQ